MAVAFNSFRSWEFSITSRSYWYWLVCVLCLCCPFNIMLNISDSSKEKMWLCLEFSGWKFTPDTNKLAFTAHSTCTSSDVYDKSISQSYTVVYNFCWPLEEFYVTSSTLLVLPGRVSQHRLHQNNINVNIFSSLSFFDCVPCAAWPAFFLCSTLHLCTLSWVLVSTCC